MNVHRTDIQMRFGDTDALGHVNNVSFASYAETARLDFMHNLGGRVTSLILANLTIDFRRQIALGERLHIDTWVERIGTSSIALAQTLWANDERAADIRSVIVNFDYTAGQSKPLADDVRDALAPFVATT